MVKSPIIPTFYTIPKIHKNAQSPPGRPIVSGIGSLTEPSSIYIDEILKPFVTSLPSFVQDTMDALRQLDGIVLGEEHWLACLDIESLYTSILHDVGLHAVKDTLKQRGQQFQVHNVFVIELLEYILKHNYSTFNNKYYHQLRGTAMGSTCAPSYANLYLGWWERNFVFSENLMEYTQYIILWLCYIDDVVIIWSGTQKSFSDFVALLNTNTINLKVTSEINKDAISFLDIKIYWGPNNDLQTTVYRKETATNSL